MAVVRYVVMVYLLVEGVEAFDIIIAFAGT
jgi:hypothetical protein